MTKISNDKFIHIQKVNRIYSDGSGRDTIALRDVSLDIQKGEFISFIGPSGCGKTTLLRLIAGLDTPQSGSLVMEGFPITAPAPERGYVFQQPTLFPWETVEGNIGTGLRARGVYRENKHKIQEFIADIGLQGFEKAYPHQISGGMAQRVAIARAMINEPKMLLLDEPLGALDAFTRLDLQHMIHRIWKQTGTTAALVTHDVDEAIYLSTRIAIMTAGPGRITEIVDVKIAEPRDRNEEGFVNLRKYVLDKLKLAGSDSQKDS